MKVEIKILNNAEAPYAVIYTSKLTEEIQNAIDILQNEEKSVITGTDSRETIAILEPSEIFMVRVEEQKIIIYSEKEKYKSSKRLYELENMLGNGFMKISKTTVINLKKIKCVEPSFKGMLYIVMKNGLKDYISRTYLPQFKKYLGM